MRLLLLTSLLCLSSCGFHLRGAQVIAPELHHLYVHFDNSDNHFASQLQLALQSHGIELMQTPHGATTLDITHISLHQQQSGVSSTTHVRQQVVRFSCVMQLLTEDGRPLTPAYTIAVSRTYSMNNNRMLASDSEHSIIVGKLHQDVINRILMHLTASDFLHQSTISA